MRICVCLSTGRHPVSGRERAAASDRVAIELALSVEDAELSGLHVGEGSERVLRDYLGMGLKRIQVMDALHQDAVEVAARALLADPPDLVLCGRRAETADGTGLFPYLLAERLGWPILSEVGGLAVEGARLRLLQVAKGGRRRLRTGSGPAVLAVAAGAVHPRLASLVSARAGEICQARSNAPIRPDDPLDLRPARRRGARLRPGRGAAAPATAVRTGLAPDEAARAILEFLRSEGHLARPEPVQTPEEHSDA